jgi:hypothetical protein
MKRIIRADKVANTWLRKVAKIVVYRLLQVSVNEAEVLCGL